MERVEIDKLMKAGEYERLAELLRENLEEEYDEYAMFRLGQAYLLLDDAKSSRKILKRLKMLYPAGEFLLEVERALTAIQEDAVESYLKEIREELLGKDGGATKAAPEVNNKPVVHRNESVSLSTMLGQTVKKKKKQVNIPESIRVYFEDVIGLENVQVELNKFYKLLRFQNERKQNDFQAELLKSTHFAVTGPRGCGKTLVGEIISGLLYDFGVRAEEKAVRAEARVIKNAHKGDKNAGVEKLFAGLSDATVIVENIQDILIEDSDNDTSVKAIFDALEQVMRNRKDDLSIVLTGTEEAMKKAMVLNDELQDVIHSVIDIKPYSSMELLQIAHKLTKDRALRIHNSAEKALLRKIDMECKSTEFMNAITIGRYLDQAAVKMAERYFESDMDSETAMVYLMPEDFEVEMEDESLEELLAQLDALTGLQSVKAQVKKRIEAIAAEQQAQAAGADRKGGHGTLHMLFTGNPGTGKTTVARIIGKIYQQLGVLPRGNHMVECTRSDLVGQYQGHTAKNVREKVKEAMGGVLFIDEAYSLCRDDGDSFGHEAVDELIAAMENNKDHMMVILAGYQEEMEEFLKTNSGFNSRIRNRILFEDYSVEEMVAIFKGMVKGKKMHLDRDTDEAVYQMLEVKSRVPDFGNARGVRNLFEEVLEVMNERLVQMNAAGALLSKNEYEIIRKEDIQKVSGRKADGDKTLEELLEELNSLTGLQSVKAQIQEMVDDIQVKTYLQNQGMAQDKGHGTLHLVFKGNAGTGKTTVARLLGKIYKKLGLLSKNVFVETGRKDLVGQYQGHTAPKVIKKVKEAEGGILFIDEAYTLNKGEHDEFGREAIDTLVAEIENRRDSLMVIVAGYAEDMDRFLDANQGLSSRLSKEIIFEDYTMDEMYFILQGMVTAKGMKLAEGTESVIKERITAEKEGKKDFGNARGVRNIVEQVERKKNSRIAALMREGQEVQPEDVITLIAEDFQ